LILATLLVGGLLGATLVRMAPGFGVDPQELDTRLSEASLRALRDSHAAERNVLRFYASYLAGMLRGDLGISYSLGRPVRDLLAQRIPTTFRAVAMGLAGGWLVALALALPAVLSRRRACDRLALTLSGTLLCLPSAVVALLFLLLGGPVPLALAVVVFPRVFRYSRNLLLEAATLPHVLAARAKGLGGLRILARHIWPAAAPQLLALAGVSVNLAFGAAIPIEVVCDSPGVGQLAWQAALARDLPLLVNLTVLVALVTQAANCAADLAATASRNPR
jgi:peptide/nickel transport system permease protein